MNPGDLKHRITIQKLITATNENGFKEESWVNWKTVWAKVVNLYGKEFWSAKAVQAENTVKFTIRYQRELDDTKKFRIIFGKRQVKGKEQDRVFNISFIDNIKYQNSYQEIKAMEVE